MTVQMNALQRYRGGLYLVLLLGAVVAPARAAEPECPPATGTQAAAPTTAPDETADPAGTIRWSGCHLVIQANGDTELSGDVTVATNGRAMHCDRLTYQASTQDLKMSGTVRFEDAAMRVTGDAGNYGTDGALFTHAQFEMLQHPGRGVADSVSMREPNLVELSNVSYTTCPRETPDWELNARRITLDTKSMRGVGHHTVSSSRGCRSCTCRGFPSR